eukprot:3649064-Pleurochrysis_carterae.AAC.1
MATPCSIGHSAHTLQYWPKFILWEWAAVENLFFYGQSFKQSGRCQLRLAAARAGMGLGHLKIA